MSNTSKTSGRLIIATRGEGRHKLYARYRDVDLFELPNALETEWWVDPSSTGLGPWEAADLMGPNAPKDQSQQSQKIISYALRKLRHAYDEGAEIEIEVHMMPTDESMAKAMELQASAAHKPSGEFRKYGPTIKAEIRQMDEQNKVSLRKLTTKREKIRRNHWAIWLSIIGITITIVTTFATC